MLYHEKQVAALCGVHCLNTLLQGPYFSEIDLAQIAQGLDELERALVDEGGLGEASGNVAMDGMFSIQVLSRALESWGLQVVSLESEEARAYKAAPTTAGAFICNLSEHWFTLRRVAGGDWWNFNSLFPAPQPLSTFYLQAFLDSLRGEGWTIFVVTGALPAAQPGSIELAPSNSGKWWSPQEARAATDEAENARKRGRVANALEGALARAQAQGGQLQLRSRRAAPPAAAAAAAAAAGGVGDDVDDDEDADLAAAIAASLQQPTTTTANHHQPSTSQRPQQQQHQRLEQTPTVGAHSLQQQQQQGPGAAAAAAAGQHGVLGDDVMMYEDDDPELAMAIAASLAEAGGAEGAGGGEGKAAAEAEAKAAEAQEEEAGEPLGAEPEEGAEGVIEVAFRLPTGARLSRRFALSSPASHLFAYTGPLMDPPLQPARLALSTSFPKKELPYTASTTLGELGLTHRTLLVAEPKR